MKLAVVTREYDYSGGTRVVEAIAKRYSAPVFCISVRKEPQVEVIRLGPKMKGKWKKWLLGGLFLVKSYDGFDVVNVHTFPALLASFFNERTLWYCHSPPRLTYDLWDRGITPKWMLPGVVGARILMEWAVAHLKGIVVNSKEVQGRVWRYFGLRPPIAYPGIEVEAFWPGPPGDFFFYPSRFEVYKNHEFVLRAFSLVKREVPEARLILAGSVSDEGYFERVRQKAREIPGVEILTEVEEEELKRLYSESLAVLFPPLAEDFGIVPLEGMASGKPVIALNQGGPRETVVDGKTGFLVENEKEMAERMLFLWGNREKAAEMGKAARERAKEFSWERFFEVFDEVLRGVAGEREF